MFENKGFEGLKFFRYLIFNNKKILVPSILLVLCSQTSTKGYAILLPMKRVL